MRKNATTSERTLWEALRRRQLSGLKFCRQHVVAGYIVDFYCPALRLAVEVDGRVHDGQVEDDRERDDYLLEHGVRVVRIRATQVVDDLTGVLAGLTETCAASSPPPRRLRRGRGRGWGDRRRA